MFASRSYSKFLQNLLQRLVRLPRLRLCLGLHQGYGGQVGLISCSRLSSFQLLHRSRGERLHLANGNRVEPLDAVALRQRHVNELGVHVLEVREDEKLFQRGVVAHVAVLAGIGVAPFAGGLAEEGDVEKVCFVGVGDGGLFRRDFRRDEVRLDGVGVETVMNLGEGAVEVPGEGEAAVFILLEALEFLDEVELEFRAEPRAELKGDVLVGVGAAVAAGTRDETIGSGQVDPLLGREEETVPARLISNSLEFEGIKTGVVDAFPDAEEQDGVLVLGCKRVSS